MNLFRCVLASGGTGTGGTIMVTCDESFAGLTITCTNNTDTYTQTCPSTSPYVVYFENLVPDTWTISGIISGTTYSSTVEIPSYYPTSLTAGFDYKAWVTAGGLDPDDYASLSAVFADEAAVRRLMLVHASADYLIDCVTDDITVIDDFCANDTAMKWLGLCDYVCDGLTAITGVEAKLMASTYWERYLKDHVPVMTSDSAPYGTASCSSVYSSSYAAYMVFNGNKASGAWSPSSQSNQWIQYEFTNPICLKMVEVIATRDNDSSDTPNLKDFDILGSNDGSIFNPISSETYAGSHSTPDQYFTVTNNAYYKIIRIKPKTIYAGGIGIRFLQFYGRQLSVSVPVMTSNTAPFGVVSASGRYSSDYAEWKAFGGGTWGTDNVDSPQWIQYEFVDPMVIRKVKLSTVYSDSNLRVKQFEILGSDDGTNFTSIYESPVYANTNSVNKSEDIPNDTPYKIIRMKVWSYSRYFSISNLQFYGLDYSEREFEAGTTKKWLYDHGLELESIDVTNFGYSGITRVASIKNNDFILMELPNEPMRIAQVGTDNPIDLTPYTYFMVKIDAYNGKVASGASLEIVSAKTYTSRDAENSNMVYNGQTNALIVTSFNQAKYTSIELYNSASGSSVANKAIKLLEMWLE